MSDAHLVVGGVDLAKIRNKNELRVARLLDKVLAEDGAGVTDPLDIQDVYALTLNLLPSRYRQLGTIVLSEPVKDSHIESAIRRALRTVKERPNR
ncbi:late competence development ComFB family protein [Fundidesulfovibrio terrae]|uniref:late competence development ComFB family protein n=1 Tax=Fundidesulfovibrio terrae TaxID=2922866 RepID=UPI001FAE8B2B|nr:late competence development ComFB family protein [Fundidesulfovibrio terrae]